MGNSAPLQFETYALVQRRHVEGTFARVVMNADGLFVNDVLCAPRTEILGASIGAPREDGHCAVFLIRQNKMTTVPWQIDVQSRIEGEQLLRAAGLASDQHVLTVCLEQWTPFHILTGCALGLVGLLAIFVVAAANDDIASSSHHNTIVATAAILLACAFAMLLVRQFCRFTVSVGNDGVLVDRFLSRSFIAFGDIVGLNRDFGGFGILHRVHGPILVWQPGPLFAVGDLFAARMEEGARAQQALDRRVDPFVISSEGTYRVAAVEPSRLEDAVIDSSRPLEARVMAAETLRARTGEAGRERIRAIAATTVSPSARVALESVARKDERATRVTS